MSYLDEVEKRIKMLQQNKQILEEKVEKLKPLVELNQNQISNKVIDSKSIYKEYLNTTNVTINNNPKESDLSVLKTKTKNEKLITEKLIKDSNKPYNINYNAMNSKKYYDSVFINKDFNPNIDYSEYEKDYENIIEREIDEFNKLNYIL